MPIHDWTRVNAGIFYDFHHEWISTTMRALISGLLPHDYYALAEQITDGVGPEPLIVESVFPIGAEEPQQYRYARPRKRIVIRHTNGDHVVAIMEIVSPRNKASRPALRSFVERTVGMLYAGVQLLIVDLFPPGPHDPQGIHEAIWCEMSEDHFQLPPDKPFTLVAYSAGKAKCAYVEPVAVGDVLQDMPLFLEADKYMPVPLETTYQAAWAAVPPRWQRVLEGPPS
jgi:hypothetical protein